MYNIIKKIKIDDPFFGFGKSDDNLVKFKEVLKVHLDNGWKILEETYLEK